MTDRIGTIKGRRARTLDTSSRSICPIRDMTSEDRTMHYDITT